MQHASAGARWTRRACRSCATSRAAPPRARLGHCEILLQGVRVPADRLLGDWARALRWRRRAWAGRQMHHCVRADHRSVRCSALSWRPSARWSDRRSAQPLAERANVQEMAGRSRIEIDQARLLGAACGELGCWTRRRCQDVRAPSARQSPAAICSHQDQRAWRAQQVAARRVAWTAPCRSSVPHGPVAHHAAGRLLDLRARAAADGRARRGAPAHRGAARAGAARAARGHRRRTSPPSSCAPPHLSALSA